MGDTSDKRPLLEKSDTLDQAPTLSGSLQSNGLAQLDTATEAFVRPPKTSTEGEDTEGDDELEDYDEQQPELGTMIQDMPQENTAVIANGNGSGPGHLGKLPVRLEKTKDRGLYNLRADDPEIREILRRGLARRDAADKRTAVRDLVFTRRFTTFDRQNPQSYESPFHGFFTLFWLGMALMFFRVAALNWKQYGSVLGNNEVMTTMFSHDVLLLGVTDGIMCAATLFGFALQKMIVKGWLRWERYGYIIQNIWQTVYLGSVVGWTFYREWPWTHTIFIVLHAFVFIMKQHSHAFYNGYCKFQTEDIPIGMLIWSSVASLPQKAGPRAKAQTA